MISARKLAAVRANGLKGGRPRQRKERLDVHAIETAWIVYERSEGQAWFETPAAWMLCDTAGRLIKRVWKRHVKEVGYETNKCLEGSNF